MIAILILALIGLGLVLYRYANREARERRLVERRLREISG